MSAWLPALLLILVAALPPAQAVRAVLAEPRFDTVADAGAIADSVVSALAVDRTGFLWVGTAVGLVRYDGHEFRRFAPEPREGQARNLFVRSLMVARDGRLWLGSDRSGVAEFDPRSERWTFHQPLDDKGRPAGTVRTLAEDDEGGIWAGSIGGGLHRLNPRDGSWRRYGLSDGLPDARVPLLMFDGDGSLWVGTWKGLARLAKGAQRFEPVLVQGLPQERVISLLQRDTKGRLWLGTQRGELLVSEGAASAWRWLDRGGEAGAAQALVEMEGEEVWIGRSGGLEIRRAQDGALQRLLRYDVARPWGLGGTDVRVLARDASGLLWLGSYGGGLQKHVPNGGAIWVRRGSGDGRSVFGVVDVRSLAEHPNGEIWAGTSDRGVAVLDSQLRLLAELRATPGGYQGGRAGGLALSLDGTRAYVASDEGVAVFDTASRRWLRNLPAGRRDRVRTVLRHAPRTAACWPARRMACTCCAAGARRPSSVLPQAGRRGGSPATSTPWPFVPDGRGLALMGSERGLFLLPPGGDAVRQPSCIRLALQDLDHGAGPAAGPAWSHLWIDTVNKACSASEQERGTASCKLNPISERIDQRGAAPSAPTCWKTAMRQHLDPPRRATTRCGMQFDAIGPADGVDMGTGWYRSYAAPARRPHAVRRQPRPAGAGAPALSAPGATRRRWWPRSLRMQRPAASRWPACTRCLVLQPDEAKLQPSSTRCSTSASPRSTATATGSRAWAPGLRSGSRRPMKCTTWPATAGVSPGKLPAPGAGQQPGRPVERRRPC